MYALEYGFAAQSQVSRFPSGFCEDGAAPLSPEDWFRRKYRHWLGRSGRSYVFSAYAPQDCPAYEDAVLIVAENETPLACLDLGPFPEARMAELRSRFGGRRVEFQVHVLADRDRDRRSLIEDISRAPLDA